MQGQPELYSQEELGERIRSIWGASGFNTMPPSTVSAQPQFQPVGTCQALSVSGPPSESGLSGISAFSKQQPPFAEPQSSRSTVAFDDTFHPADDNGCLADQLSIDEFDDLLGAAPSLNSLCDMV
jgi:hypothetical protein